MCILSVNFQQNSPSILHSIKEVLHDQTTAMWPQCQIVASLPPAFCSLQVEQNWLHQSATVWPLEENKCNNEANSRLPTTVCLKLVVCAAHAV